MIHKTVKEILKTEKDKLMSKSKFDRDWELITALNTAIEFLENDKPQGEWINFDDGSVACPICGTGTSIKSIPSVIFFRYCPYCGARLKGGME